MDYIDIPFLSFVYQYLTPADLQDVLVKFTIAFLSLLLGFIVARITFKTPSKDKEYSRIIKSGFKTKKELIYLKWDYSSYQYIDFALGYFWNDKDKHLHKLTTNIISQGKELPCYQAYIRVANENYIAREFNIATMSSKSFNASLSELILNKQNFKLFKQDNLWKGLTKEEKYTFYKNRFIFKHLKISIFKPLFSKTVDDFDTMAEQAVSKTQLLRAGQTKIDPIKMQLFSNRYIQQHHTHPDKYSKPIL